MLRNLHMLQVRQLDQSLELLRQLTFVKKATPKSGWIAAIRKSLGMSESALAKRLGVSQSAEAQYEKSEKAGTITLQTLEKVAAALDADLVYAIVPRRPLKEIIEERAAEVARGRILPIAHSMSIEDQSASVEDDIENLKRQLLEHPRELWR